jgi:hypothetical protein
MSSLRVEPLGPTGIRRLRRTLQRPPAAGAVATLAWGTTASLMSRRSGGGFRTERRPA